MNGPDKVERFLKSVPEDRLTRKHIAPGRQNVTEDALCDAGSIISGYLRGYEHTLGAYKQLLDEKPLAFTNQNKGETALFSAIRRMLATHDLNETNASEVAKHLKTMLDIARDQFGKEYIHRMVNPRCHACNIREKGAEAWTVRDLMEKSKMMSYMALREFNDVFADYKFETSKVRGI